MRSILLFLMIGMLPSIVNGQRFFEYNNYQDFNVGIGLVNEEMPEGYRYNAITLIPAISIWHRGHFSIYGEGQYAYATLTDEVPTAHELGLNFGVRFQTALMKRLILGAAIGAGPHFITVETRMQADGFIFSDNFELGFSYYLDPKYKTTAINLKGRMRHISNAGLQLPNWGLDNFFLVLGVRTNL